MSFFKLLISIHLFFCLAHADMSGFVLDLKKDALPEKIKSELGQTLSNTSEIDSKIIGAIFICKPYCKFLQFLDAQDLKIRYQNKEDIESLHFINRKDPVFDFFFKSEDLKKMDKISSIKLEKTLSKETLFFYDYRYGLGMHENIVTTNSNLQQSLSSNLYQSYMLGTTLIFNYPFGFSDLKFYPYLKIQMQEGINRKSKEIPSLGVKVSDFEWQLQLLHKDKKNIWGAGLLSFSETLKASENSFLLYGFKYQTFAANISFWKGYWNYEIAKGLIVNVNEDYSYRAAPASYDWLRLQAKWMTVRKKIYKGYMGSYGVTLQVIQFKQSTQAAPELLLDKTLTTQDSQVNLIFSIEAGELWQKLLK